MESPQAFIDGIRAQTDLWTTRTLSRNEYLTRIGEIENYMYFVESGALRVVYVTEFEEQTIRFGYKNSLMTSLRSFYDQSPSEYYIQAIRKTEVQAIRRQDYFEYARENETRLRQYNAVLEWFVLQMMERENDLLTHSPVERVRRVQERSPQLFQEVPAKYIAAYLRMTPETLSRIRNS